MCRNIKQLRRPEGPPSDAELQAAALQFVRKISGYRAPSRANQRAFETAVREIAAASRSLFDSLQVRGTDHLSLRGSARLTPATTPRGSEEYQE
jgi:hypothetical protein